MNVFVLSACDRPVGLRRLLLADLCSPYAKHFQKHMSKFLEAAVAKIDPKGLATTDHTFGMECLGTAAQIVSADWHTLQAEARLTPWIKNVLASAAVTNGDVADDVLLQVIVLCGTMAAQQQSAQSIVPFVDDLVVLLRSKSVLIFFASTDDQNLFNASTHRWTTIVPYLPTPYRTNPSRTVSTVRNGTTSRTKYRGSRAVLCTAHP